MATKRITEVEPATQKLLQTRGAVSIFDKPEQSLKRLDLKALNQSIVLLSDIVEERKPDAEQMQAELFLKFILAWSDLQRLGEQVKDKNKRWRVSDIGNVLRIASKPKDLVGAIVDMQKGDNRLAIKCFLTSARSLERVAINGADSDSANLHRLALEDLQRATVLAQGKKV